MPKIFEAEFEIGDLSEFSAIATDKGEVTVEQILPFQGLYHGVFLTRATAAYAHARCYWILPDMDEVYARAYLYIHEGLPLPAEDDRFFIISVEHDTTILAFAGIRKVDGVDRWVLMVADRTGWNWVYGKPATPNQYHCVELHWKSGGAGVGLGQLFVDGVLEAEFTGDTAPLGLATRARYGVTAKQPTESVYAVTVYGDTMAVADTYIGPVAPPTPPAPSWIVPVAIGVTVVVAVIAAVYLLKKKS